MAKLTNEQKYRTAEERVKAFGKWVGLGLDRSVEKFAHWLVLEAEEEKPEPCPECNSKCEPMESSIGDFFVGCSKCYYRIGGKPTEAEAIAAHNRVARAVRAAKESEAKR